MTGGRNGFGAKLANIFSKQFVLETGDSSSKRVYKQTFKNNMSVTQQPVIEKQVTQNYTKVTFWPDLERFKMKALD